MHSDIERGQSSDMERGQEQQTADRLRRLPLDAQPPYDWLEFQRRAQIRAARGEGLRGSGLRYAAVAAVLSLVVVGSVALMSHGRALVSNGRGIRMATHPASPVELPRVAESQQHDVDARTQAAERWLASAPPEPVIVRFGTRVAVTRLEDRIAQVDDLLTAAKLENVQPARVAALQKERGLLVNSLVQVRYAEALMANTP